MNKKRKHNYTIAPGGTPDLRLAMYVCFVPVKIRSIPTVVLDTMLYMYYVNVIPLNRGISLCMTLPMYLCMVIVP